MLRYALVFIIFALPPRFSSAQTYDFIFNGYGNDQQAHITGTPQQMCEKWSQEFGQYYYDSAKYENAHFVSWLDYFHTPDRYLAAGNVTCHGVYSLKLNNVWVVQNPDDQRSVAWTPCPTGQSFDNYLGACVCPPSQKWVPLAAKCVPVKERSTDQNSCPMGHPIYPLTGAKGLTIELGNWLGLPFYIIYDSRRKLPASGGESLAYPASTPAMFDGIWETNVHKQLSFAGGSPQAFRGKGRWIDFSPGENNSYTPSNAEYNDRIIFSPAAGMGFYYDGALNVIESYSDKTIQGDPQSIGQLTSSASMNGGAQLSYSYQTFYRSSTPYTTSILLMGIVDQFGRSVLFGYAAPTDPTLPPHITTITDPAGGIFTFDYDVKNRLSRVTWPDGTYRQFLYENQDYSWALTGVVDESGARYSTYAYGEGGRATDTQLAGEVDHFNAQWDSPPLWTVAETYDPNVGVIWRDTRWVPPQGLTVKLPNGVTNSYSVASVNGMIRATGQSQAAGSGCAASNSAMTYDVQGNIVQREDFNGNRVCIAYDLTRNLETARVEGLAATTSCESVLPTGSTLPAKARRTTSQWHPNWRVASKVTEPRKITSYVYNGQIDPITGGTVSCAPYVLPDRNPIAVLCKQVEQATTDVNGSQGFAATLSTTVAPRVQSWTYNQYGQVLTATDPLGHVTTSTYYPSTTADHTMGDLQSVTNAASQVTQYTKYNPMGQVLESIDPNGITTTYTYDLRQRLTSVSTAGVTTSYAYWPTGLLKQVTLPDTSIVAYGYDDAHRLTSVSDGLGNKIVYTLDNAGVRIGENVEDPSGALSRSLSRVPDALGRIQQVTGQE